MSASASTEEIRAAYRALARRLHPDRQVTGTPAERALAERRMREINVAWQVLGDADRRRAYDDSRLGRAPAGPGRRAGSGPERGRAGAGGGEAPVPADDDLVDVLPPMSGLAAGLIRHLPWVVLLVVLGVIFVLSAYATGPGWETDTTVVAPGQLIAEAGSCVDVDPGPVTTIVPCDGPHDLQVVVRVDEATSCPPGTERRRLAPDGLLDCVTSA